ncbi:MAG: lipoate--protein ligase [Christensenellales bacterium]|jgi:lipoate-protein ligase A
MLYIQNDQTDPYFNLALEEYVFHQMSRAQKYLWLWRNDHTIVVGKHQNTQDEIRQDYVEESGIRVVRRLTGGGAVYHDLGNINFTFIDDWDPEKPFDFSFFIRQIIAVLKRFGVHAQQSSRNDICVDGKKFSGNAQLIANGRILHHGTLLFRSNLSVISQALTPNKQKTVPSGTASVQSAVTNLSNYLPDSTDTAAFLAMLKQGLRQGEGWEEYSLSPKDIHCVRELRRTKYSTERWNYGHSPQYNRKNTVKISGGMVSAYLQIHQDILKSVRFFGDFFGSGELSDLEQKLLNIPLQRNTILSALADTDVGHYIHSWTAEGLADCLLS